MVTPTRAWVFAAGAVVGLSAAVATAHGSYEVAHACGVPTPIAALYPVIADGLALVAYASTARLTAAGRCYAWSLVVIAAGLSGLAQASYLAGSVERAPTWLQFGIGAWPAVAAALVAHLLYLIGRDGDSLEGVALAVQSAVQPSNADDLSRPSDGPVDGDVDRSLPDSSLPATARERALAVARDHSARTGALPTVNVLAAGAGVARGTAATALQEIRGECIPPQGRGGAGGVGNR